MTHYIIYKLKNEEDYAKICDELTLVLENMKKDIEGVKAYSFVKNAFKGNYNYDMMIKITMLDEETLKRYKPHELHVKLKEISLKYIESKVIFDER